MSLAQSLLERTSSLRSIKGLLLFPLEEILGILSSAGSFEETEGGIKMRDPQLWKRGMGQEQGYGR